MKNLRIVILVVFINVITVLSLFAFWTDPQDCIRYKGERTDYSWPVENGQTCWFYDPYIIYVMGEPYLMERWSEAGAVEDCEFYPDPDVSCRPWECDLENMECSLDPFIS
jgi:hypothetical protein